MSDWTHPTDMTLDDFRREGLSVPGMLVEFHNRYTGGTETALIGHMNDLLGVCDDCHEDGRAQVVRYRRVWSPEDAPAPSVVTEDAVTAFKAAWHAADDEGRAGERVRDGLAAALPHLTDPEGDPT